MIKHIVAVQKGTLGIGKDGGLPWRLPADLKHFKEVTKGHVVMMGRKTFESLPNGPLPNRLNIVVSRDESYAAGTGAWTFHSIDDVLEYYREHIQYDGRDLFIIGGAEIYMATSDKVDEKIVTIVDGDYECDTFLDKSYMGNIDKYESRKELLPFDGVREATVYVLKTKK